MQGDTVGKNTQTQGAHCLVVPWVSQSLASLPPPLHLSCLLSVGCPGFYGILKQQEEQGEASVLGEDQEAGPRLCSCQQRCIILCRFSNLAAENWMAVTG